MPKAFKVRDKVIFLRRSEQGMIFKGCGEVKEVVNNGVMIIVFNPKFEEGHGCSLIEQNLHAGVNSVNAASS
jgi:hypothetical protein